MVVLLPAPPVVLLPAPAAPEPLEGVVAPLAASFMQRSFSSPIRCSQLVPAAALPLVCAPVLAPAPAEPLVDVEGVVCELVLPETPELGLSVLLVLGVVVVAPAPAEPLVDVDGVVCELVVPLAEPLVDVEGLVCELVLPETLELGLSVLLVLGVVVVAPAPAEPLVDVDGVACELVLPLAAPCSRRQRSFAAPVMASQSALPMVAAAPPEVLPLVCAPVLLWPKEAPENASSAAAVELTKTFSIM